MPFPLPPSSKKIKNLVLSLDAFGTIFHPRRPIAQQYISAAKAHGLNIDWKDEGRVLAEFKGAFKGMSKEFPNYGKGWGMEPEGWWAEVIKRTFQPFIPRPNDPPIHTSSPLIRSLLRTFSNDEGYVLYPDTNSLFRALYFHTEATVYPKLKYLQPLLDSFRPYERAMIGVVTNSDTRVLHVLRHLGLFTSEAKAMVRHLDLSGRQLPQQGQGEGGTEQHYRTSSKQNSCTGISFVVLSYHVGAEKPSREMFDTAREIALGRSGWEESETDFIHVGDDFAKDVMGAREAGWGAILLDRDGTGGKGARAVDDENQGFVRGMLDKDGTEIDVRVIRGLSELVGEPPNEPPASLPLEDSPPASPPTTRDMTETPGEAGGMGSGMLHTDNERGPRQGDKTEEKLEVNKPTTKSDGAIETKERIEGRMKANHTGRMTEEHHVRPKAEP